MSSRPASHKESPQTVEALEGHPVATGWRVALGVLGLVLLGVSCYSVLTADNELGATTLAVVGVAALLVCAVGHWPTRLIWGDKSAEWGVRRIQQAMDSGAKPGDVAQLAAGVARTPLEHLLAFQLWQEARGGENRFASTAMEVVADAARPFDCVLLDPELDSVWDGRLVRRTTDQAGRVPVDESVVVLCSRNRPTGGGKTLALAGRLQAVAMRGQPAGVLVVTEYPAEHESPEYLAETFGNGVAVPVHLVQLESPGFAGVVAQAVADLP